MQRFVLPGNRSILHFAAPSIAWTLFPPRINCGPSNQRISLVQEGPDLEQICMAILTTTERTTAESILNSLQHSGLPPDVKNRWFSDARPTIRATLALFRPGLLPDCRH
jgi:hypothetical protein